MVNWDEIKQNYIDHNGDVVLKDFAAEHGVRYSTLRSRKNRDKWDDQINVATRNATQQHRATRKQQKKKNKENIDRAVRHVMENPKLNDKQRLFCLYYSKSFNATRSYQKAYGCSYESALRAGPELLGKIGVKEEITRLKEQRYAMALLKPEDIFQKYMDIAFADITDYLSFGQKKIPVSEGEDGEPVVVKVNTVDFRESSEVDGTLIGEIKQGKDGASIKLPDRMKALQWLTDHMSMATEGQRAKIDKLRAEADKAKAESATVDPPTINITPLERDKDDG